MDAFMSVSLSRCDSSSTIGVGPKQGILHSMKKDELRDVCRSRGLPISGSKTDLLNRIFSYPILAEEKRIFPLNKSLAELLIPNSQNIDSETLICQVQACIFGKDEDFAFEIRDDPLLDPAYKHTTLSRQNPSGIQI